ncbi:hypothetical protein [Methylopila turkensis]|uniref:Uncharacterized protein n=1 Tax=Methylopila turkensis TaxID=1437816 RepID=A0A9W6JNL6_9HYPH|nr:hypothetical protein [Methylopila turkensis]GLK79671.1 hypothetical protein GCM10008174_14120 [Methylopila turkensis]
MGLVLAFQSSPRPSARPANRSRAERRGADILFFTGVRYERHGDAGRASAASSAPARTEQPTS